MGKPVPLNEMQKELKIKLQAVLKQVWDMIDSDYEQISQKEGKELINDMATIAHELHTSLKGSGHEVKHHKYMYKNRGVSADTVEFYQHIHPVEDLLDFLEDEDANIDPDDITLGDKFVLRIYTRRWGHYDIYSITRNEQGWLIDGINGLNQCKKDASDGLNKILDHDCVCYPKQINEFFEWLWDKAKEDGLSKKEVQFAIDQLGEWISECEIRTPRDIFRGLI